MASTVYTYELKTIECASCGAPLTGTLAGARVTCSYCSAVISVAPRLKEARPAPLEESVRLAGLRAQLDQADDPANPLAARTPAGLEHLDATLSEPTARPAVLEAYRRAWQDARSQLAGGDAGAATQVFRLALRLDALHLEAGDHSRSRAVLETALDLLPRPEQRDIVRCRLARAALRVGDLAAFTAWMKDADPRSPRLEVDTEHRSSMALYFLHQRELAAILTLLGEDGAAVPLAPSPLVLCLRSHALAGLRREEAARGQIAQAAQRWDLGVVRRTWTVTDGPATRFAEEAARAALHLPRLAGTPATSPPGRRGGRARALLVGLGALAVVAIVVHLLVPWQVLLGEPYALALARLEACPAARMTLGSEVSWSWGQARSEPEPEGGGESWSLAVRGARQQGTLTFSASRPGGRWALRAARLQVGSGRPLDVMTCRVILPR